MTYLALVAQFVGGKKPGRMIAHDLISRGRSIVPFELFRKNGENTQELTKKLVKTLEYQRKQGREILWEKLDISTEKTKEGKENFVLSYTK